MEDNQQININTQGIIDMLNGIGKYTDEQKREKEREIASAIMRVLNDDKPAKAEHPVIQVIREILDMDMPDMEKIFTLDRFIIMHRNDAIMANYLKAKERLMTLTGDSDEPQS